MMAAVIELALPGALVVAGALVWTWRLGTLDRGRDRAGAMARGQTLPVSIVVPARDEAHNLPALLGSLQRLDPAPLEIIVVDDHSSDDTGAIARAHGVRVIQPPPLPAGWNGKPWACHAGAGVARGAYLLFTDADTVHAPDSLGRAMARMRAREVALLSVVPTHVARAWWERLQGVFHLLLLIATRAGAPEAPLDRPGAGAGAPARRGHERRFSIGQYLLFRRDAYEAMGGHESSRLRIAEDLALARRIAGAGLGFALLFSPGLLRVRMYPEGLGAFLRGWRRNFREGMAAAGAGGMLEMIAVIGWLLGVPLFAISSARPDSMWAPALWSLVYLVTAAEVARRQRHQGDFPAWTGLLYPLFATVFVLVSALAVIDHLRRAPVRWRGRTAASGGKSAS